MKDNAHSVWLQVPGEDLTPYRAASKAVWAQLARFGAVQRGGLDEAFLDATDEVRARAALLAGALSCAGGSSEQSCSVRRPAMMRRCAQRW